MENRLARLEKVSERLTTVIEYQSKAQDMQGKSIDKILGYMSDMHVMKNSHKELQDDVNKLGGKVEQTYVEINIKEAKMQKEIDINSASLRELINGNRDELKSLMTNRLIWIIGVTLTGVMIIAQHFESLHSAAIKNISKDISSITKSVEKNKDLGRTIDINLKNLATKVDEYNMLHNPNRGH